MRKKRNEHTSRRVARIAAIATRRPDLLTVAEIRSLAGSALTQARNKKKRRKVKKIKRTRRKK